MEKFQKTQLLNFARATSVSVGEKENGVLQKACVQTPFSAHAGLAEMLDKLKGEN